MIGGTIDSQMVLASTMSTHFHKSAVMVCVSIVLTFITLSRLM